jgi:hypothetical protein
MKIIFWLENIFKNFSDGSFLSVSNVGACARSPFHLPPAKL